VTVHSIRSVLWIGPGEHFVADLAADAPTLDVVWERDVASALALRLEGLDAVVIDMPEPKAAVPALEALRGLPGRPPLLVRIDAGEVESVAALRAAGAADVLLREATASAAELVQRLEAIAGPTDGGARNPRSIIGDSREMQETFALVDCASRSRATVLVTGETGTGKELIARAIHDGSPRRRQAFVALNCAAFPDTLLESELFGHARGAFTGADRDHKGLFESADRGTLFLDEVCETSGPFQAKLLRVLQEREVRPLGGTRARRVDVRVIAASNRDLWRETVGQGFREDLYYRLAVFPIHVPPLRNRPGDLLLLAEHFLALHGRRERKRGVRLSPEAAHLLQAYRWPGNVRELENEIQRALALSRPGEPLTAGHFSNRLSGVLEPIEANAFANESLRETLGRIEAWLIRRALEGNNGSRTVTARQLAITREGLYK